MKYLLVATAGLSLIAGCTDPIRSAGTFDREAGSQLDVGDFGNATMNNTLVQNGELDYTINLARRFSAEVNDTINFAFDSTQLTAPTNSSAPGSAPLRPVHRTGWRSVPFGRWRARWSASSGQKARPTSVSPSTTR